MSQGRKSMAAQWRFHLVAVRHAGSEHYQQVRAAHLLDPTDLRDDAANQGNGVAHWDARIVSLIQLLPVRQLTHQLHRPP
eukprot:2735646-Alexandrium_andersonii.AAC.1